MNVLTVDTTRLLVSPEELARDARKSLDLDILDGDDLDTIAAALESAQARVETYMARRLMVDRYTLPAQGLGWSYSTFGDSYTIFAPEWPVVQTDEGVVSASRSALSFGAIPEMLDFYAGYRGRSHTLADLQVRLPELTELPDVVPADVRLTIVELALIYLNAATKGTLGTGGARQQVGQSMVTVESVDREAEQRALRRLLTYQRAH